MWTDWTQTDPHYFFARGAFYGAFATCILFLVIFPALKKWIGRG